MTDPSLDDRLASLEGRVHLLEEENRRLRAAKDVQEIQNVMSLHEYYHSAAMHEEELAAIWSQTTDDVAFEEALFDARFVGLGAIRTYYVDFMRNTLFRSALDLTRGFFPQLADDPEDELAFGLQFVHTLTTPLIHVAGDRQTAKGVWISPGYTTMPTLEQLVAYWHWDRYAVDFIREDGEWKIWHFFVGREFTSAYDKSWVETAIDDDEAYAFALAVFREWPGFAEPPQRPLNQFSSYSPHETAALKPRLPEPYETFSETFSY